MIRAFLDSSVLVAAIRSPTGGSGEVLRFAVAEAFEAVISDDVVQEVARHFEDSFPS